MGKLGVRRQVSGVRTKTLDGRRETADGGILISPIASHDANMKGNQMVFALSDTEAFVSHPAQVVGVQWSAHSL
jgi:hypothetical protein